MRRLNPHDRVSRTSAIMALTWETSSTTRLASLLGDGTVQLWERTVDKPKSFGSYQKLTSLERVFGKTSMTATSRALTIDRVDNGRLCACNGQGKLAMLKTEEDNMSVVQNYETWSSSLPMTPRKSGEPDYPAASAMTVERTRQAAALGGKDRDVVLLDLSTGQSIWKAKNLPPDPQTLLQPLVWPSALHFLSADTLAVGSAHQQVRLYDVRTQRRPVASTPADCIEHRVTALTSSLAHDLIVGDAAGYLYSLDVRQLARKDGKTARYVGPAGSIRQLVHHTSEPRLACVGLDRMVRVYDTTTRKETHCLYLRQRLNCVLMDDSRWPAEEDFVEGDSDIDQDDVVKDYVDSEDEEQASEEEAGDESESEEEEEEEQEASGDEEQPGGANDDESESEDEDSASSQDHEPPLGHVPKRQRR